MVKLKINSIDFEVPEGMTVLDVAESAGLTIPTMCHNRALPHYSSCMACMVKDNRTNGFIPSCSALVQEGMDISTSSDEVISLRRKAIELLLSEHRAECEAPCKVVCPAGYNIPLMNRYLMAEDYDSALKLSLSQVDSAEILCTNCPGYCENACRRKKIDIPVSIRNIQLFVAQNIKKEGTQTNNSGQNADISAIIKAKAQAQKSGRRFASRIGKLEESEMPEWLKECSATGIRHKEIPEFSHAASEAGSCMHCDCRAAENCKLRDYAEEFSVKDPRGKLVNSPIVKKINLKSGLIFENAKCIKCGLCVRLCEESGERPALCFIYRGFVSIISEPLGEEFDNILKTKSKEVIEICPTGALSQLK